MSHGLAKLEMNILLVNAIYSVCLLGDQCRIHDEVWLK